MWYPKGILFTVNILILLSVCFGLLLSCKKAVPIDSDDNPAVTEKSPESKKADPNWPRPRSGQRLDERQAMVDTIKRYGLDDPKVLDAMLHVPRHWFVREAEQRLAYTDGPLPIGHGQTISQPYIVAYMSSLLELDKDSKVLEIGTGSGYQAAVLTEFTPHVFSIEIVKPLGQAAQKTFKKYGYSTIKVKIGDGYQGWPAEQPFDAIIVTCAPDHIPPALLQQLKPNGRMIIPVGSRYGVQELILVQKDPQGKITRKSLIPVRFVPLERDK